jgi:hypothetical protein
MSPSTSISQHQRLIVGRRSEVRRTDLKGAYSAGPPTIDRNLLETALPGPQRQCTAADCRPPSV